MSDNQLLDAILPSLADQFEANKGTRFLLIRPSSVEEFEPLRELLARQSAAGLMIVHGTDRCRLTPDGYRAYLPRITALRALGSAKTA